MDMFSALGDINNIYNLIAMIILAGAYLAIFFRQQKTNKSQTQIIVDKFTDANSKIVGKLDELREQRNTLDLQSSMDLLELLLHKSEYKIKLDLTFLIERGYCEEEKLDILYNKVKTIIHKQYEEDILILSRIYHSNTKLSVYIESIDVTEVVTTIVSKFSCGDDGCCVDVMDYVHNKYNHEIQTIKINLSQLF